MKNERIDLYCKKCSKLLTLDKLEMAKVGELKEIDGEELVPFGKYINASEAEYNFTIPIKYLVHSESLRLINHPDTLRQQGCCGPGEFGLLNKICPRCNSEIGLLIADCWTSKFIGIDVHMVSFKPTKQKR